MKIDIKLMGKVLKLIKSNNNLGEFGFFSDYLSLKYIYPSEMFIEYYSKIKSTQERIALLILLANIEIRLHGINNEFSERSIDPIYLNLNSIKNDNFTFYIEQGLCDVIGFLELNQRGSHIKLSTYDKVVKEGTYDTLENIIFSLYDIV